MAVPPRREGLDHDDHDVFVIGKEQMPHVKCNWYSMINLMQTTSTCVSPTTKVWKGAVANHPRGPKVKKNNKERKNHKTMIIHGVQRFKKQ